MSIWLLLGLVFSVFDPEAKSIVLDVGFGVMAGIVLLIEIVIYYKRGLFTRDSFQG